MVKNKFEAELGLNNKEFIHGLTEAEGGVSKFGAVLGKATVILGAITAAFGAVVAVMKSTEGTSDKLTMATEAAKGAYQGLMKTIATGDLGGLIDNITKTAKAYKDLAAAQDMMEDIEASNVVKRSYLEKALQNARVAAAAAEDPNLKAQYLEEAISNQKAITDINVSEIKARLEASEKYYKTITGFDDEANDLMIQNFRKIAGNWETFYGENGQYALLLEEKQTLIGKEQKGTLSDLEKVQLRQVRAAIANLEIFKEFQDNLKEGEFNEYVKTIGDLNNAYAKGDQELVRLTSSLKNATAAQSKFHQIIQSYKNPNLSDLNEDIGKQWFKQIGADTSGKLAPGKKLDTASKALLSGFNATDEWKTNWEDAIQSVTGFMADTFGDVFERIGKGSFEGFGKDLLGNFGKLLVSFGKMAVAFGSLWLASLTLMKAPTIPTALAAIAMGAAAIAAGSIMVGAASRSRSAVSGGGGGSGSINAQSLNINVQGKLKGKDIYFSGNRYATELNTGS